MLDWFPKTLESEQFKIVRQRGFLPKTENHNWKLNEILINLSFVSKS